MHSEYVDMAARDGIDNPPARLTHSFKVLSRDGRVVAEVSIDASRYEDPEEPVYSIEETLLELENMAGEKVREDIEARIVAENEEAAQAGILA